MSTLFSKQLAAVLMRTRGIRGLIVHVTCCGSCKINSHYSTDHNHT